MSVVNKIFDLSDDDQLNLIHLYDKNKKQWKSNMIKIIKKYPNEFKILNAGTNNELNYMNFKKIFKSFHEPLIQILFNEILHSCGNIDTKTIKFTGLSRYINNVNVPSKKKSKRNGKKNETWIYKEVKSKTLNDFDSNQDTKIDRKEFYEYFSIYNIDKQLLDILFDLIDTKKDDMIDPIEFAQFKNKKIKNKYIKLCKVLFIHTNILVYLILYILYYLKYTI